MKLDTLIEGYQRKCECKNRSSFTSTHYPPTTANLRGASFGFTDSLVISVLSCTVQDIHLNCLVEIVLVYKYQEESGDAIKTPPPIFISETY